LNTPNIAQRRRWFADEIATAILRVNAIAELAQNAVIGLSLCRGGSATALQRRLPPPLDEL
jgi:hypothetical protein